MLSGVAGNDPKSKVVTHARKGLTMEAILGGSWVVIGRVISPLIWVITIVALLITPLITTHEPPSRYAGKVSVSS